MKPLSDAEKNRNASLLLQLWQLFPREAYRWLLGNFSASDYKELIKKYPRGSAEFDYVAQLREFYETAGVLVTRGLLDENLFFDISYHIQPVWDKLGPVIKDWRKSADNPAIEENMEWLAKRFETWSKEVWKPHMVWKLKRIRGKK